MSIYKRNINRQVFDNTNYRYNKIFANKNRAFISQLTTPSMIYPLKEDIQTLSMRNHIWSYGDTLPNLAFEHYGYTELWWIIAFFNKKPAEFLYNRGDTIRVPHPLERVLALYGYF